jgi:uncharacterized glyoxalase superfamily protein PhnB
MSKHHTVTPYFVVDNATEFMTFTQQAFGASIEVNLRDPKGKLVHGEVRIGDSAIMIGEAPGHASKTMLYVYVDDVDTTYRNALAAGGRSVREPKQQFYGDRNAAVEDRWGNQWWMATHVEDVSEEDLLARSASENR